MRMRCLLLAAFLFVALRSSAAHAWSYKEHIQLTRIAASNLINDPKTPPAMKAWLQSILPGETGPAYEKKYLLERRVGQQPEGFAGILWWVYQPDVHALEDPKDAKVDGFPVGEAKMHFIDLEYFLTGDKQRKFAADLSGKAPIDAYPNDKNDPRYIQSGMLPLRVADCYTKLVAALKAKNFRAAPTSQPTDDSAERWAAYLAHYLEDNTQPQHSTEDYKSASFFPNVRKAPNVHGEMEYRLGDDEKQVMPALREEYWKAFESALKALPKDPIETKDPFRSTLEVALKSYDNLTLIGQAAAASVVTVDGNKSDTVDTAKFFHFRGNLAGKQTTVMEMKARQQAWAVRRVEHVFRDAWRDATGE